MSADASTIDELEERLIATKRALAAAYRDRPPDPVEEYELRRSDGTAVTLSALFHDGEDLIVVHNMGRSCPYCTMWADGFDGLLAHLEDRAAFVVASPDPPAVQREFAAERGWEFQMVSTAESDFTEEMGFADGDTYRPGVSTFHRADDGTVVRVASRRFGPFDDFCSAWNFFAILADGVGEWEPRVDHA